MHRSNLPARPNGDYKFRLELSLLSEPTGSIFSSSLTFIPLIIWIIKKDEIPFVRSQGKEVLNFQISWTIYGLAAALVIGVIGFILTFVVIGIFILWALAILAGIYVVVMAAISVIGTLNAADGKPYKYPATIRFIK